MSTSTASTTPWVALCAHCAKHGPDPLTWRIVTCPECGQQCSCVGCVADVVDREPPPYA
jgi:hypothetical protein